MNVRILTIEKHQNVPLKTLEEEYIKRLSKWVKVQLEPIRRTKINTKNLDQILRSEAELVLEKNQKGETLILLDVKGKSFDSEGLAGRLQKWQQEGVSSLLFVIGGPHGFHLSLKQKADFSLSLSSLTFTHEMARMLLCEALYRSFDILAHGNYHKA